MHWFCVFLVASVLLPGSGRAGELEKLVMPGPLAAGHADIEGECSKCHAAFRAEKEQELCSSCHEDVAEDIAAGVGFHGRGAGVASSACRSCHAEHLGREADITGLDRDTFDHDFTDFPLSGGHERSSCGECHAPDTTFREATHECGVCHESDDAHSGSLGKLCGDCHTPKAWAESRFDHSTTRFPLVDRHADAACAACHPGDRYEQIPRDCASCHGLNDVHLGRFGADCGRCHSAVGWKQARFDHGTTDFPLLGAHTRVACNDCHEQQGHAKQPPTDCIGCHRLDDEHRGRNGSDCAGCHDSSDWKRSTFDHDSSTDFPLQGAHLDVRCNQCHPGDVEHASTDPQCVACHLADDVHDEQQGRSCDDCHRAQGWSHEVFFEHDLTRMPLLGLHAVVACEQCHPTPRFKDADIACFGCHEGDDAHLSSLGTSCEQCHNPNSWNSWRFDHALETGFPLQDAHAELACEECHAWGSPPASVQRGCDGCHARDDRHFGAFGRDCQRCHGTSSWSDTGKIQ